MNVVELLPTEELWKNIMSARLLGMAQKDHALGVRIN
jgi:hypothetical protein